MCFRKQGLTALFNGWTATFTGYFLQGAFKFGFYDFFKHFAAGFIGVETVHSIPILIACSGFAELIASFALCPLEGTKIFMITNPEISKKGLLHTMKYIFAQDGLAGFYVGFQWVLLRQIPYTCVKLAGYDSFYRLFKYQFANFLSKFSSEKSDKDLSKDKELVKQLTKDYKILLQVSSGVVAGLLAATFSQPADVILSKVCSRNKDMAGCLLDDSVGGIAMLIKEIGFKGCFAGIKQRASMVAIMTAMQFVVYENSKEYFRKIEIKLTTGYKDIEEQNTK